MKYEGIGFNAEWIKSKTWDEFFKEAQVNQHWFANDPKRNQKLRELYQLATGKTVEQKIPSSEPELKTQSVNPGNKTTAQG